MPGNAEVSGNITGRTVGPLGPHCTVGTVGSTVIFQIPAIIASRLSLLSTSSDGDQGVRYHCLNLTWKTWVRWWVSSAPQQLGHHSSSVRPFHQDRCVLTALGRNLQWHVDRGTLERGGGRTTHQLFGTQSSHLAWKAFLRVGMQPQAAESGPPLPTSYPCGNRQYNRRGVCEQEGRLDHHLCPYWTVVLPADPGFMDVRPSLTGSVECGSKRSFEVIQHAHRDASEGCLSVHSTSLLCSGGRPVRVAFEPSAISPLCRDFPTPVLQRWMPFNRTGASGRVLSTHQFRYYLEFSES